ncbi:MAG: VCBS repeat-containing protein [Acidobacteriales bacterium]|nr:VCBS repeat-containing protein [Terriglobales bacterium]
MKTSGIALILVICAAATLASAQQFVRAPIYSAGSPSVSVATADFNGDGYPDLAFLSDLGPAAINIRLGTADGNFNMGQQVTLGATPVSLLAGDWNGDGVPDLAVGVSPWIRTQELRS